MEGRRRNNHRRSQNRNPLRGSWQPTVAAWEKEFCKVVGLMDWETLVQLKKFMHLYDNVMEWNDSAGEEAFSNAKRQYWAKKNSLSCDIPLPDPDLYIDEIDWDSGIDPEEFVVAESPPMTPETEEDHDPVVIFGNSAMPNQDLPPSGWGDDEDYLVPPVTHSSANNANTWVHSSNEWASAEWPGNSNDGWQGYSNDAWQYNNGDDHGYMPMMPWEGWNWNCANNYNYVGPDTWNENNNIPSTGSGGRVSGFKATRVRAKEHRRKHMPKGHDKAPHKRSSAREWSSNSREVVQTCDQE